MEQTEQKIEGRNPVIEAFRSGKTVDKIYILDGCQDGPIRTIVREARKQKSIISFVSKERLDQMSETRHHQGVIAICAAYSYAEVDDILKKAEQKGEDPFIILLDGIEDPYKVKSGFLKNKDSYSWTMVYISYDLCPKYRKCNND